MSREKKKNNRLNSDYWKGIPDELRRMCLSNVNYSENPSEFSAVAEYLLGQLYICDSFLYGVTPYDVIRWIDRSFELCLFPLETNEDEWIKNWNAIEKILNRSEELIRRYAPTNYSTGYRTPEDRLHYYSIIEYSQKLDVFYSCLYMIMQDYDKYKERLKRVLESTQRNVKYLISLDDAENYVGEVDWAEDHYVGTDTFEPLIWIGREYIPAKEALSIYVEILKKYTVYLKELEKTAPNATALSILRSNARSRLNYTCGLILYEIEESLYLGGDDIALKKEKEYYLKLVSKTTE